MTGLNLDGPLVQLFISAFVTLFVVIDPPGCVPIFSSLTAGTTARHRRDMAVRSSLIAGGVLIAHDKSGAESSLCLSASPSQGPQWTLPYLPSWKLADY